MKPLFKVLSARASATTPLISAMQRGCRCNGTAPSSSSLSFAMSGCGWLWPFYLGVIKKMKSLSHLTNDSLCAGTSGGSLGAMVACLNIEPELALDLIIHMSKQESFKSDIDKGLKESLKSILPDNAVEQCNGKLHVVTTKLWPNPTLKPTIISSFKSNDELIDTVAASCFIPFYSSLRLTTRIKGHDGLYADGGILAFMPLIGDVKVSPFNRVWIKPLGANPDICLPIEDYPLTQLLVWSLKPAEPKILNELFLKGQVEAEKYCLDRVRAN